MSAADDGKDRKAEELTAMVRAIRDRVRSNHPSGPAGEAGIPLANLEPLLHARDAAEGKVAAIGTVNPRASGPLNSLIQSVKRLISRALDWHVREQVEYNRALVECINATIEALNESNRAVTQLAAQQDSLASHQESLRVSLASEIEGEVRELKDIRTHWEQWRQGWEQKLVDTEIQFLRGLADIRGAFDQRLAQMDGSYRAAADAQSAAFAVELERSVRDVQKALWDDLERVREQYERLIHNELRVVRQRAAASPPPPASSPMPRVLEPAPKLDYLRFADRFRGDTEYVKRNQEFYINQFSGCERVVDLGCGRGEFLEGLQSAGIPALGVDLDEESVNLCKSKGLAAEVADIFEYLERQADSSLGAIFCSQVIEHLPPAKLPELVNLAASKLNRGGLIAFETPNPECLAIFATHFYLDPTHTRPVPASLMSFYLEEAGFGRIEVHQLSPAAESMPSLTTLPEEFRKAFFGGLDYAVLARRL